MAFFGVVVVKSDEEAPRVLLAAPLAWGRRRSPSLFVKFCHLARRSSSTRLAAQMSTPSRPPRKLRCQPEREASAKTFNGLRNARPLPHRPGRPPAFTQTQASPRRSVALLSLASCGLLAALVLPPARQPAARGTNDPGRL